ncbi:MAG TPA: hypothetical protein VEL76_12450 [Gemmataceae bacterium]|nr:hypothetical protein [Gemmataceae bacterium]
MSEASPAAPINWNLLQTRLLLGGGAGVALCALGALLDPTQFFRSWLFAFVFWLAFPLGGLVILMIQHQTGGRWGLMLRRPLEAAAMTLPVLAAAFVPVAFGVYHLYRWADLDALPSAERTVLAHKQGYLNVPFFLIRSAVYFAVWIGVAWRLQRWSDELDRHYDKAIARRMQIISGPGLVLYGLTITFAAIDWIMSLEPHWYSSIFGAMIAGAQLLPAFAAGIIALVWLSSRPPVAGAMTPTLWGDLGNLLLAFVMIWAYLTFSQFLLIWSGNLKEEIPWYLNRITGGWEVLGWGLILFYFAMPFAVLLSRNFKRDPYRLVWVAGAVVVMHLVYVYWLIAPAFGGHGPGSRPHFSIHWLDAAALLAIGGVWLAAFLWRLQQRPLLPLTDPALHEAEAHHG